MFREAASEGAGQNRPERYEARLGQVGFAPTAGRIAQLVEQLTLNQRVQGSNPCAPTNEINDLDRSRQFAKNNTPSCGPLGVGVKPNTVDGFLQQDRGATGSAASAEATITANLGAEVDVACVALISSRLGGGAMVQARLADATNFVVIIAGTGLLNAKAQDESQGNVLLVFPVPVT